MGLFKKFTEDRKATKEELNAFKWKLKCGDDPNAHWKSQEEHWEKYKFHKESAYELLRKIYNVEEVNKHSCYSKLEVWIWSSTGPCPESPISEHVYVHHFGDKNPRKGETPVCLACEKELKL